MKKLRAAVGAGILLMSWFTIACTRQTPGNPSSDQGQQNNAETTPPKSAPAPTAVEGTNGPAAVSHAPATSPPETSAAPATSFSKEPQPEPASPVVLPAGTSLVVRNNEAIGAQHTQVGQTFQAVVAQSVSHGGHVVIPQGSTVTGAIVQAHQGGKIHGGSDLALKLTSVRVQGISYPINTDQFAQEAKGKGKRTALMGGGGAGLGAVIGGIAGGGKGAAIGALTGGGAGVAGSALTGNKELTIPAESVLHFKLTHPLQLKHLPETNPAGQSNQ